MPTINSVPSNTRKPGAYFDINTKAAKLGLPVTSDRVLLIGVQLSTATTDPEELVQIFDAGEAHDSFGDGSPLALMVEALLDQNPYISELWCCPLDEAGGGVAASGTLTVSVSSVTTGTLTVYVGGRKVLVAVTEGDTANTIAAAINTALGLDASLPFSAAVAAAVVTVTCKAKGTDGNDWKFATEFTGTGLTVAIVQPAAGAGDPDIQDALDIAEPEEFAVIVSQFNDSTSLNSLKDHLDTVSGPMEQRPGIGVAGATGTVSTNTTLAAAVNSGRIWLPYFRGTRTHPMEIACGAAGALLAEADRARPLNFVELTGVVPPDDPADKLSRTEQESCLQNGVSPLMVGAGNAVQIVRSVTTYVTDSFGSDDDTLLDLQTMRVLDYTRYALITKIRAELGQAKIADTAKTSNTTDPDKIKTLILGELMKLESDLGYVEKVEEHKDRLVVERDATTPTRVNCTIPADIVDGLHVLAATIDLILG